jgi:NTP pyrophosphatase (non-canonical NTP hydrolase)
MNGQRDLNHYVRDHIEFDEKYKMLKQMRDPQQIMYLLVCLAGETGESANVFKKYVRDGVMDWDHFAEEMVDVFVYLCMLFGYSELDFEKAYQKKMRELHRRWEERTSARKV